MSSHLNYVILHDKEAYYLFERLGKKVPFSAYNRSKCIRKADSPIDLLKNQGAGSAISSESPRIENPKNPAPQRWEIEESPYEVIFNE